MDIATLQIVIDMLKIQHEQAYERYNLHPSDPYCEGKVIGAYEALTRVEALLREELEYRDARTA
jgi:hypothetical protein